MADTQGTHNYFPLFYVLQKSNSDCSRLSPHSASEKPRGHSCQLARNTKTALVSMSGCVYVCVCVCVCVRVRVLVWVASKSILCEFSKSICPQLNYHPRHRDLSSFQLREDVYILTTDEKRIELWLLQRVVSIETIITSVALWENSDSFQGLPASPEWLFDGQHNQYPIIYGNLHDNRGHQWDG